MNILNSIKQKVIIFFEQTVSMTTLTNVHKFKIYSKQNNASKKIDFDSYYFVFWFVSDTCITLTLLSIEYFS